MELDSDHRLIKLMLVPIIWKIQQSFKSKTIWLRTESTNTHLDNIPDIEAAEAAFSTISNHMQIIVSDVYKRIIYDRSPFKNIPNCPSLQFTDWHKSWQDGPWIKEEGLDLSVTYCFIAVGEMPLELRTFHRSLHCSCSMVAKHLMTRRPSASPSMEPLLLKTLLTTMLPHLCIADEKLTRLLTTLIMDPFASTRRNVFWLRKP